MRFFTLILLVLTSSCLFAQLNTGCPQMEPICTSNGLQFTANDSPLDATIDQAGNNYDCLLSAPSPSWYYLEIATSGPIVMSLTAPQDIDFIIWGPFANLAAAQASCGSMTNVVDCSFDATNLETPTIPSAVAGQVYVLLITNYANTIQDISLSQTNSGPGAGATDCTIVNPSVGTCIINTFSANISACQPNNTFTVSGDFTYTDNPGAGTLIVEIDNGTTTFTQVFNPPFVDGQLYNYSLTNIPADGAPSTITVYFSADPSCSQTIPYTAISDCSCAADIGTFTATVTGQSSVNYALCFGDGIDIVPDGNFNPPGVANNPPGPAYDPGIGWLVFSCPPTVGLTPSATEDIANDPCLVGVSNFGPFSDVNDLFWINSFPGVFTNNTVYFVPITFYSMADGTYSYVNTSIPCYDLGQTYAIQYLPEMTSTQSEDCAAGTVTGTFNGGSPALDGSSYTAIVGSLTPANASFNNTTCAAGGSIVISGVNVGDAYSFDVADPNGCTVTISGIMQGSGNATITYPQSAYCADQANPSPTLTGTPGGTYTSSAGLVINSVTGVVDLAASVPGTYSITYVGSGAVCPPTSTFVLTINALPIVVAGPDQVVCAGTSVTLSGSGAQVYTWDNGVVNNVPFTPAATNTYTVTGTTAAGCQATDQVVVTIQPSTPPQFSADILSGCSPLTVTFTNASGGTNCTWDFGDGTTGSGCATITHTFTSVGCYDIVLTTEVAGSCSATTTLQNYICVTPDPIASFSPVPTILTQLDPSSQMINGSSNAVSYQWNFGDGGTSTLTNPSHAFPSEEPGSYVIELIATSASGCTDTAYATVVIEEELIFYVPNTFTPDGDEFNQTFQPVFTSGFDPFDFNMLIFNRWGEIIFETNNAEIGWDGTYHGLIAKEGTYTWKIEFKTSKNDARKVAVGHLNLLR